MVEKVITLDNVSLIDFLGVENRNIKEVATAFPESKIISRGNQIRIKGTPPEIVKIQDILKALLEHYHQYGQLTQDNVQDYLKDREDPQGTTADQGKDEVLVFGSKGAQIVPKTRNQRKLVTAAQENDVVFAIGPAGTGKTYISVALAVQALKNKEVKKIIITRPAVEAGENLGFLPGDLQEKIDPYLRPIYDALDDMIHYEKLQYYLDNRIIEIAPLAYMRGRTLNKAFILLDEAQNTTPMQLKMFLTRMGPQSKMIVNGDRSQIDLPKNQESGLINAANVLKDTAGIAFVELDARDVVRHRIVKDIINAYNKAQERTR
ncbi:MAG: phosphate starvation protein PhoH [Cyclobacteriaceae bacterium]|nr:MAG: phosphate starvation protein PhoH [Cyclobacteriaceae bacterium]